MGARRTGRAPVRVNRQTLESITGQELRDYASRYVDIEDDLLRQIMAKGVALADAECGCRSGDSGGCSPEVAAFAACMPADVRTRNDHRSFCRGWISPACEACRTGAQTTTFYLNVACNRDCFFCFNPNQEHYADSQGAMNNLIAELDNRKNAGMELRDIALTGGEPLLYPAAAVEFFKHVRELYPSAYTRLYTNGDFADDAVLRCLADADLQEIRFSVKQDNPLAGYASDPVIERIHAARGVIPCVVVEMPVMPGDDANMRELLRALEEAGCDGVNLLELCYPFHRWEEFAARGMQVKNPPFRVPYQWEYAGGLPIEGSEATCLRLLEWAAEEHLAMGVHYCSLENKFSSQVYLQDAPYRNAIPGYAFSERDFFFKACKVFGRNARRAAEVLSVGGCSQGDFSLAEGILTCHPRCVSKIARVAPDVELALCYAVLEGSGRNLRLRELALDYVRAGDFNFRRDV